MSTRLRLSSLRRQTPVRGRREKTDRRTFSSTSVSSTLPSTSAHTPLSWLRTLTGCARASSCCLYSWEMTRSFRSSSEITYSYHIFLETFTLSHTGRCRLTSPLCLRNLPKTSVAYTPPRHLWRKLVTAGLKDDVSLTLSMCYAVS